MAKGTCTLDGCEKPLASCGLCGMHYYRLRTYGDPLRTSAGLVGVAPVMVMGATTEDRFWHYVEKRGPDDCWPWTASRSPKGYGQFMIGSGPNKKSVRAHRFAWESAHGEIPDGLLVLHHCDNPPCCNPFGERHLFLGTNQDNTDDMMNKGRRVDPYATRTHCPKGHPLSGDNLRISTEGWRICRRCLNDWTRANRLERRRRR